MILCVLEAYVGAMLGLCWGYVGAKLGFVGAFWGYVAASIGLELAVRLLESKRVAEGREGRGPKGPKGGSLGPRMLRDLGVPRATSGHLGGPKVASLGPYKKLSC